MKIRGIIYELKHESIICKRICIACAILAVMFSAGSCSKRAVSDIEVSSYIRMRFGVRLFGGTTGDWNTADGSANSAVSRSMLVTSDSFYDAFGVFGYSYSAWSATITPNLMYNAEVTKDATSGEWEPTTICYWPGKDKVRFYAYAPYNAVGATLSGSSKGGAPTLAYEVAAAVADQQDILIAKSDEFDGDYCSTANLKFDHALTGVKFVTGDECRAGTITKITLKGVYSAGTCSLDTGAWSSVKDAVDFAQTVSVEIKEDTAAGTAITSDAQTFIMMPQTLPSGAVIEIEFTPTGADPLVLSAVIGGSGWEAGKTVTYRITISKAAMEIDCSIADWVDVSTGDTPWEIE